MARLAALGVQVHVTELDVGIPIDASGNPMNPVDLSTQADIYRAVATACAQQPACTAFQTWGFTDKYPWIVGFSHGQSGAPLLFDRSYAPKPAYQAVLEAVGTGRPRSRP